MRGLLLLLVTAQALMAQDSPTPVVLWHGMGDSAAGMVGIAVSTNCYLDHVIRGGGRESCKVTAGSQ